MRLDGFAKICNITDVVVLFGKLPSVVNAKILLSKALKLSNCLFIHLLRYGLFDINNNQSLAIMWSKLQ